MAKKAEVPPVTQAAETPKAAPEVAAPKAKSKKPEQPVKIRLIHIFPKAVVVIEPPYTEETTNGNRSRRKTYPGEAIKFRNSFADVTPEQLERAMELPNARLDYMPFDDLKAMQESDDPNERFSALKFLQQADLKRLHARLPKLTKEVIAV